MLLPCDHLLPESIKPKSQQSRTKNPPVRNGLINDTIITINFCQFCRLVSSETSKYRRHGGVERSEWRQDTKKGRVHV